MGKSTINGHFQQQTVSLPEGNCYTVIHLLVLHLLRSQGMTQEMWEGDHTLKSWSREWRYEAYHDLAQKFENTPASTLDSLVWGLWCHMSMKSCEPKAANHWLLQIAKVIWVGTLWLSCDGKLQTSVDPRSVFCLVCAPDPHFASETCICLSCRSLLCFGWAMIRAQGSNIWIKQHNGESPSLPNQAWDGNAPTVSLHGQSTGNNSHIHRCICICICLYLCIWICLSICPSIPSSIEFWLIQLMHQVGGLQTLLGCSRCPFLSTSNKSVGQRTTVSPGQRSRVMLMIQPPKSAWDSKLNS